MNGLLQRLARQALDRSGPRIRSAAAVHAQVPIVLPSRPPREASARWGFDFAASASTTAAPPATPRDSEAHLSGEPSDRVDRAGQDESRQPIDTAVRPADVDDRAAPITLSTAPPAPPPLLDHLASSSVPAVGSIRPVTPDQPKRRPDREANEVHVHIGRIEVTAVAATTPAKQRERTARQSVPLSDYLAKRRSS
jgi:hypothetical protein